jgi:hypothetical protein
MMPPKEHRPAGNGAASPNNIHSDQADSPETSTRILLAEASTDHNGLRATLESTGVPMQDVTVLAVQNDPFRVDTPARHRDGAWLADNLDQLAAPGRSIYAGCTTS